MKDSFLVKFFDFVNRAPTLWLFASWFSFTIIYLFLGKVKLWAHTMTALSRCQGTRRITFLLALLESHRDQMWLFPSWTCILPVIEEHECDYFRAWSSWPHRMGVAFFCIRPCRQRTESFCSPWNKIHLTLIVFYSMMPVNADSLGTAKYLQ